MTSQDKETSTISPHIRLGNRQWIKDHLEMLLIESIYHRTHKVNYTRPRYKIWTWHEEEGRGPIDEAPRRSQ